MTILQASKLKAVLDKARNAGHCEESATICGVSLVFSSLPTTAYTDIIQELEDTPELEYPIAYQIEHVCRSIVEVDGADLRDVSFIEVETEDPETGELQTSKVERHQWIKDELMASWSRELVITAFRKVLDAIDAAEEKSKAGVDFRIQNESDEDRFHRLLAELRDAGAELPPDMRAAILKDHGLLEATSKEELEALNQEAKKWLEESRERPSVGEEPVEEVPQPAPQQTAPQRQPAVPKVVSAKAIRAPQQLVQAAEVEEEQEPDTDPEPPPQPSEPPPQPVAKPKTPREMLQGRVPMNRQPIAPPIPDSANPENQPVVANPRSGRPPAEQVAQMPQGKAAQYAALEADAAAQGVALTADMLEDRAYDLYGASPVLETKANLEINQEEFRLNRPPVSGVNKKFVDPIQNQSRRGIDPRNRGGR